MCFFNLGYLFRTPHAYSTFEAPRQCPRLLGSQAPPSADSERAAETKMPDPPCGVRHTIPSLFHGFVRCEPPGT